MVAAWYSIMARKRTEHPPASVFMEAILKALWEAKGNGVSQEETQKIFTINLYRFTAVQVQ